MEKVSITRMRTTEPIPAWQRENRLKAWTVVILTTWFVSTLGASLLGMFNTQDSLPMPLGMAAIIPIVAFAIGYFGSSAFRQFVLSANLQLLTLAQTWRLGAIVFLILYSQGVLPGVFALPAGWGDIAIGATAPLVAWAVSSRKTFPKRLFVAWNLLGTLDLVMAVTLGILSSATPFGILAGESTTEAMGRFPLSMVPTFFVPLLMIFHLIAIGSVRNNPAYYQSGVKHDVIRAAL